VPISIPKSTKACLIREYEESDIPRIAEIEFDPITKKYVGLPSRTKEEWLADANLELLHGWVVVALPENIVAGRVCLNRAKNSAPGVAEFEIIIAKEFWGRKLGRAAASLMLAAAFEELNAKAILAEVHPENEASLALLKEYGFTYLCESEKKPMHIYEVKRSAFGA
jgi:RimJ/RimL family protein N-acetyltransferase